jgi:hypothetical protein
LLKVFEQEEEEDFQRRIGWKRNKTWEEDEEEAETDNYRFARPQYTK